MPTPVPFGEFGPLFFEDLLTPELVNAQVRAALAERMYLDEPEGLTAVSGWVERRQVGEPARTITPCAITYTVPIFLNVHLGLRTGALPEILVELRLTLEFRTYLPLVLYVHIPPVTEQDLTLTSGGNIIDHLIIQHGVKGKILERVNESVRVSEYARTVDLEALLLEQTATSSPDAPILLHKNREALLPRDATAECTLPPSAAVTGWLLLHPREEVQVIIYAQSPIAPYPMYGGVNATFTLKTERSWETSEHTGVFVPSGLNATWGPLWTRAAFPAEDTYFRVDHSGWYAFRLENSHLHEDPARFKIRQVRRAAQAHARPKDADRICFDRAGAAFFLHGLTAGYMQRAIGAELEKAQRAKSLRFPLNLPVVGPVDVEVSVPSWRVSVPASAGDDWRVMRRVECKVVLCGERRYEAPRAAERLFTVPVTATLDLALSGTKHPAAVQVHLVDFVTFDVNEARIQVLDEHLERAVRALAGTELVERAQTQLREWVSQTFSGAVLSSSVISELAEQAARATLPGRAEASPVFSGFHAADRILQPGRADSFPFTFTAKRPVRVAAAIKPQEAPGLWGAHGSITITDEAGGVLEEASFTLKPGSRRTVQVKLSFKPPERGEYTVWVSCLEFEGETFQSLTYTLDVH